MVEAECAARETAHKNWPARNEDHMLQQVHNHQVVEVAWHLISLRIKFIQFWVLVSEVFDQSDHHHKPHEVKKLFDEGLWVLPIELILADPLATH
jgi:hypothetical protein